MTVCFRTGDMEYIGLTRSTISYDKENHQWKLVDSINQNISAVTKTSFRRLAIGKSYHIIFRMFFQIFFSKEIVILFLTKMDRI